MLLVGAFAVAIWPRRKSPLQLAAYTAVLLAGFEMVQTYWLYTYIVWFFPFAAIALLVPATGLRMLTSHRGSVFTGLPLDPSVSASDTGAYDSPPSAAVHDRRPLDQGGESAEGPPAVSS
jgi:hypothetical protein